MSQHDYIVDNAISATVRADINAALAAGVSLNSGATEPTTTYAYMWWADTTTGLLKRRNSTNASWVTIMSLDSLTFASPTMTGTTQVAALTASGLATLNGGVSTTSVTATGNLKSGTGTTTSAGLEIIAGSTGGGISGYGGIWAENLTPSGTNYSFITRYDGAITALNAGTSLTQRIANTTITDTTSTGVAVTGAISATTTILSSGATSGIGYTTGAGGTVTQTTSKSTGVTLNKVSGRVTMNNASLAAGASVTFVLTNSAITALDTLSVSILGASATSNTYVLTTMCAAGTAYIEVYNKSASAAAEAIQIQFNVIKGAVS